MFEDKIIPAFPDQDIHITQLNEFQNGKKKKNGVYPIFAGFDYFLERDRMFPGNHID